MGDALSSARGLVEQGEVRPSPRRGGWSGWVGFPLPIPEEAFGWWSDVVWGGEGYLADLLCWRWFFF